ncbi:tetratricopeptide repeat protein [candidate division CSSED10-310 bacterium]|uniref:Tetratricopeptide repeat protein n=1 Tax=candidate division CSSED10-310 bacterium TaxID=2855610 RepID=A0ABV6YTN6_UNCC1
MQFLIPRFIHEQFRKNVTHGEFVGITLFLDISGFTSITEKLMQHGKEGAEVLSQLLDTIFETVISALYERNGFISGFAGDAFTAIFTNISETSSALSAAWSIREIFKKRGYQQTRFGAFQLSSKIGLSYGGIQWGIVGTGAHKIYYFRGPAIDGCAEAESLCRPGDIVVDGKLYPLISPQTVSLIHLKDAYYLLDNLNVPTDKAVPAPQLPMNREIIEKFIPRTILEYPQIGEFRDVAAVFVSLKEALQVDEIVSLGALITDSSDRHGGFIETLDFGDKGSNMLIIFGLPLTYENIIERAVKFIVDVRDLLPDQIRAGVTFGTVFAGIKGSQLRASYGALGDTINLSARFMMAAPWGEIWVSPTVARRISNYYHLRDLGPKSFKGIEKTIPVVSLLKQKESVSKKLQSHMIGRETELKKAQLFCKPIQEGKFGGVIYIYGEAGVGKSRLLMELAEQGSSSFQTAFLQADSILQKSLNPFTTFINTYFELSQFPKISDKKRCFEQNYDNYLKSLAVISEQKNVFTLKKELNRAKSFIGSVVGLFWDDSHYQKIMPEDRPEVVRLALKNFFLGLSLIKPLLIILEDIHWLDFDSLEAIQLLCRQIEDFPLVIFASSRYADDGSKPRLKIDEDINQNEITIPEIPTDMLEIFVENKLGAKIDENFLAFINARTEANPFYIEQLCFYLRDNKLLHCHNGLWTLKEEIEIVPSTIREILTARMDRLTYELKETVQIAAVIGRDFEARMIIEIIHLHLAQVQDEETLLHGKDIHTLLHHGVSEGIWHSMAEIKYIFQHALMQNAAYEMQLKMRLRKIHKFTAEVLLRHYKDDKTRHSDIAYHYENAEILSEAYLFYLKAGDQARAHYKSESALNYYGKAMTICLNLMGKDHLEIAKIHDHLGDVFEILADYDKALENYIKAFEIKQNSLSDPLNPEFALSYEKLGCTYDSSGSYQKALENLKKALTIRKRIHGPEHPHIVPLLNSIAEVYLNMIQFEMADQYLNKALQIKEDQPDEYDMDIANIYNNMGSLYWLRGEHASAVELYKKAIDLVVKLKGFNNQYVAVSYNNLGSVYTSQGDHDRAIEYYNKAITISEDLLGENHPGTASIYSNIGNSSFQKGDIEKAVVLQEKALAIRSSTKGHYHLETAISYHNVGRIHEWFGEYDTSLAALEKARTIFLKVLGDNNPYIAKVYELIGLVFLNKEKYIEAVRNFEKSMNILQSSAASKSIGKLYASLSFAYVRLPDMKQALKYALKHVQHVQESGEDQFFGLTHVAVAHVLTQKNFLSKSIRRTLDDISALTKLPQEPEHYFKRAVEKTSEISNVQTHVQVLYEYGKYLCNHDEQAAQLLLQESLAITELKKMKGEQAKIKKTLNALQS